MSASNNEIWAVRAEMINGSFALNDATNKAIPLIRAKFAVLAREFLAILDADGVEYDGGRVTATLDALQAAKDVACGALINGSETANRKRKRAAAAASAGDERMNRPKPDDIGAIAAAAVAAVSSAKAAVYASSFQQDAK
jgi:hypothetical protein